MLTLFKKLFGKTETKVAAPIARAPLPPSTPLPTVEVVHLSLPAITARFPDELKAMMTKEPEAGATVALPLPTILKQLPAGSVKMSLGSLQRQAHGLIGSLPPGDKRMVEVPLAEVFRHVRLSALQRRSDQLPVFVPEIGFNLFGDASNPYAISPDDHLEQTQVLDLSPEANGHAAPAPSSRGLKMDDGLREHFGSVAANRGATAASSSELKIQTPPSGAHPIAPPPNLGFAPSAPATPPAPVEVIEKPQGPTLVLPVSSLSINWPEDIRAELSALDPATKVTLPTETVSTGLAKGRVTFSWAQIHAWLEPTPAPTQLAGNTALQLPLKVVAPAFLSQARKPEDTRRSVAVDESIPALFSGGPEAEPKPPVAAPLVMAEPVPPLIPVVAPEPAVAAPPAPVAEPVPAPPVEELPKPPESVGEVFGQPHKRDWTPSELVAGTIKLPGVSGAVVALQEGLQVAASLPDGVKGDVVAAFLPQIFARLNQYSGEMKLGDVDDLLFTTHGAHCQIYRLGYVYLAVLGKPGESLPWHELRLISEELARQTHK